MLKIIFNIVAFVVSISILQAQSISLYDIDGSSFPNMKGKLLLIDEYAQQKTDLSINDFTLKRNFKELQVLDIFCPDKIEPKSISSVLMLDISGSMEGTGIGIAQLAANKWIELMDLSSSECAIGSFNTKNHIIQDFTHNKETLLNSIRGLSVYGGTDFNAAFIAKPASALQIVERGKFNRVVVLLTDGSAGGDEQEIIRRANELNTTIYCVVLNQYATPILKSISSGTSGKVFENISTEDEAVSAFMQILFLARGGEPCEISWLENNCVVSEFIDIEFFNLKNTAYAPINTDKQAQFELSDNGYLDFAGSKPESKYSKNITLKAIGQDIRINNILISSGLFRIKDWGGEIPPFTIKKDESRILSIEFSPLDSHQVFCQFTIDADACINNFFFASGGFENKLPDQKYIELVYPNGGQIFRTGQKIELKWKGITNDDPVQIEFSSDNGINWDQVGTSFGNDPITWITPDEESRNCLIKVSQNIDDRIAKVIYSQHKSKVTAVDWSDGNVSAASGSEMTEVHIWNPISGKNIDKSNQFMFYDGSFDWEGDILVSCDYQRGINVWDTESNTFSNPLKNSLQKFSNVKISPNSFYLIASEDKYNTPDILLWEIGSGELKYNFNGHSVQINDIAWSPNGIHFASCDEDSKIFLWSRFEKNFVSSFRKDNINSAVSLSFDNTGSRLLCAYSDSSIIVWDHFKGLALDSVKILGELVRSVDWGEDGINIAAGCESGAVYILRYFGSKFQIELIGHHKSAVNDIQLSDDLSMILTGSDDSTAVVWHLKGSRLSDVSDSLFAIIKPNLETKAIDMGYSYINSNKDSLVKEFIVNNTDVDIVIDSIKIDDYNIFKIQSNFDSLLIRSQESIELEFSFTPLAETTYKSPVYIYTTNKVFESEISGIGYGDELQDHDFILDFGKVLISNDKQLKFTISNQSERIISLNEPEIVGPDKKQFTFTYDGDLTIHPGEDLLFEVQFAPIRLGRSSTALKLEEKNYDISSYITCYGEGITLEGSANITVLDADATAGDRFDLKIILSEKNNFDINQVSNVIANIKFNKTILVPIDGSGLFEDKLRIYPIEFKINSNEDQKLIIPFLATLGNSDRTSIEIDNIFADNGNIVFNAKHGEFKLNEICDTGELRLIESTDIFEFKIIQNYSVLDMSLSMIEQTSAAIDIINMRGDIIDKIDFGQLTKGSYAYQYSLNKLNSGIYFCKLSCSTGIVVKKVEIIK